MNNESRNKVDQRTASIEQDKRSPHVYTTRNGTVLKLRHVPSLTVLAVQRGIKKPEVPRWFNEAKSREEENPNDPQYTKAVEDYNAHIGDAAIDTYLANGVSVLRLGDDCPLEESDWAEGLQLVGIEIPQSGVQRRVCWLKYHVIGDEDLGNLTAAIAIAGGVVTEEAVIAAAESFRNNGTGLSDTGSNITELPSRDTHPSISDPRTSE